jgi:hypothetical protein
VVLAHQLMEQLVVAAETHLLVFFSRLVVVQAVLQGLRHWQALAGLVLVVRLTTASGMDLHRLALLLEASLVVLAEVVQALQHQQALEFLKPQDKAAGVEARRLAPVAQMVLLSSSGNAGLFGGLFLFPGEGQGWMVWKS